MRIDKAVQRKIHRVCKAEGVRTKSSGIGILEEWAHEDKLLKET